MAKEESYSKGRRDAVRKAMSKVRDSVKKPKHGPTETTTFSMTPNVSGGTDTRTVIEHDAPMPEHRKQAAKEAIADDKAKKAKKGKKAKKAKKGEEKPTPIRMEAKEEAETEEQVQTADFDPVEVGADTITDDDKARLEAHLSGSIGRDISDTIDSFDIVGTAVMAGVGGAVGALGNALLPIFESRKAHGSFSKPIVDPDIKGMEADKRRLGKARASVGRKVAGIKQNQRNIDVGSNVLEGVKDTMKGVQNADYFGTLRARGKTASGALNNKVRDSMSGTANWLAQNAADKDMVKKAVATAEEALPEINRKFKHVANALDMVKELDEAAMEAREKMYAKTGARAGRGLAAGSGIAVAALFPILLSMNKYAELGQPVHVLEFQAKAMNRPIAYHQIGGNIRRQLENAPDALQEAHDKGLITTEAFEAFQTGADFQE